MSGETEAATGSGTGRPAGARNEGGPDGSEIARALRELLAAGPDVQVAIGRRLGIPPGDVAAVDQVAGAAEEIGPAELARRLGITSASATAMVDRLEATGHVVRSPHPHDRRRVSLSASADGRREIRQALAPLISSIDSLVAGLEPEQARAVAAFLRDATVAMRGYAADV